MNNEEKIFLYNQLFADLLHRGIDSFVRIFLPTGIPRMPFYVFLFACFVEVLQYFQLVETLGVTNRAARIILGSTFDWADIACYAVGCVFIVLFERFFQHKS